MPISSPRLPKSGGQRASSKSRQVASELPAAHSRSATLLSIALIAVTVIAAYWNSLSGAMVFDDRTWILENPSIRQLWPTENVLFTENAGLVGGRPVVSLTLAVNYALGGTNPVGYHVVNILIHLLAALTLFGVVRRTLRLPPLNPRFGQAATPLALTVAVLWAVHPLQTAAVTYIIQRTESLMGLFYLLTLYCVIRGATIPTDPTERKSASRFWYAGAVIACSLGMVTKEVMFTAPLVVLLYDSWFLSGSLRAALERRRWVYAALAATWSLGALMLWGTDFHGGTTGLAVKSFTWQSYLLTQPGVILHYLQLAFWPIGLTLDYGWAATESLLQAIVPSAVIVAMLALTVWALVKRSAVGFASACFFLILAPTSSFIPIKDAAFDHRMYLPLAALTSLVVLLVYEVWNRFDPQTQKMDFAERAMRWGARATALAAIAIALGWLTVKRNDDYRSEQMIWTDVIAKRPENWRGYASLGRLALASNRHEEAIRYLDKAVQLNSLEPQVRLSIGKALGDSGQIDEAIRHYRRAIELDPTLATAHYDLGCMLDKTGKNDEAIDHLRKAVALKPDFSPAQNNLAASLLTKGDFDESMQHAQAALSLNPKSALAHANLGLALMAKGQFGNAVAHFREALAIDPEFTEAETNLGIALGKSGQLAEAAGYMEKDLSRHPKDVEANFNLAMLYDKCGHTDKAAAQYERVLKLDPAHRGAHLNLGAIREQQFRLDEAVEQYRSLLSGEPHDPTIEVRIAKLYARRGDLQRAIAHYESAVAVEPRNFDAHFQLAGCYSLSGRDDDAVKHYRSAIEIHPDFVAGHNDLAVVLARQGKMDDAAKEFSAAIKLDPKHASAHTNLGMVFLREGKKADAVDQWRIAAKLTPNDAALIRNLAWTLATSADANVRNGAEAVQWAQRASELSGSSDPDALAVLAGAYAEAGQFSKAVESGEQALERANRLGRRDLADQLTERLKLYRAGSAYHEPPSQ